MSTHYQSKKIRWVRHIGHHPQWIKRNPMSANLGGSSHLVMMAENPSEVVWISGPAGVLDTCRAGM